MVKSIPKSGGDYEKLEKLGQSELSDDALFLLSDFGNLLLRAVGHVCIAGDLSGTDELRP